MLVLLRLYRGCKESLYPMIFLFITVNSRKRYKSGGPPDLSGELLGKDTPRSR